MSLTNARHVVLGSLVTTPPTPVLPANTIRCKFRSGFTPTMGNTQTLVDAGENIWDIYKSGIAWTRLFYYCKSLLEVVDANTTGVTRMDSTFYGCTNLTSVSLFDTASITSMQSMYALCTGLTAVMLLPTDSATDVSNMFEGCRNVQSGALALYNQMSSQTTPPTNYSRCFTNCGRDTVTGAAELAQIPASWGGNGA